MSSILPMLSHACQVRIKFATGLSCSLLAMVRGSAGCTFDVEDSKHARGFVLHSGISITLHVLATREQDAEIQHCDSNARAM